LKYKVKNVRNEIEVWWEKCFLSEEEKQKCDDCKSANYTPELYRLSCRGITTELEILEK